MVAANSEWTWISGNDTQNVAGIYGAQGVSSNSIYPGARGFLAGGIDSSGSFWVFGGYGSDSVHIFGYLGDLWKYSNGEWTWISGNKSLYAPGVYGTQGIPSQLNYPGGRSSAVCGIDSSGSFWLFGGFAYYSTGTSGYLNDLWKYSNGEWTWISGNNTLNSIGVYGIQGVPSPSNYPVARQGAVGGIDSSGSFWVFGGYGLGSGNVYGYLNDLWKYSNGEWTWLNGNNTLNSIGVYGTKGVLSPSNYPGAREYGVGGIDSTGSLWLFGGYGYDSNRNLGYLNDLWKYSNGQWTWISGNNILNIGGVYGTQGVPSPSNYPGARNYAVGGIDSFGSLWLFGGYGLDSENVFGELNDLWKYSNGEWTWLNGNNTASNPAGVYGTQGVSSPSNYPGARQYGVGGIDSSGSFWLFGGYNTSNGVNVFFNDLWKFGNTTTPTMNNPAGSSITPTMNNPAGSSTSTLSITVTSNLSIISLGLPILMIGFCSVLL